MYAHTYAQEITQNTYTCKHIYAQRKKIHTILHTTCTQFAHTQQQNNMQHLNNTEENKDTENNNTQAQPQHRTAHTELYTYSVDFYHEYVSIKNSNIIELYTISKE